MDIDKPFPRVPVADTVGKQQREGAAYVVAYSVLLVISIILFLMTDSLVVTVILIVIFNVSAVLLIIKLLAMKRAQQFMVVRQGIVPSICPSVLNRRSAVRMGLIPASEISSLLISKDLPHYTVMHGKNLFFIEKSDIKDEEKFLEAFEWWGVPVMREEELLK